MDEITPLVGEDTASRQPSNTRKRRYNHVVSAADNSSARKDSDITKEEIHVEDDIADQKTRRKTSTATRSVKTTKTTTNKPSTPSLESNARKEPNDSYDSKINKGSDIIKKEISIDDAKEACGVELDSTEIKSEKDEASTYQTAELDEEEEELKRWIRENIQR